MDDIDNCEGLLRKALAVEDIAEDFDPNKVPQTGMSSSNMFTS